MKINFEKIFFNIEEGRLLKKVQLFFIITIVLMVINSGIDLTPKKITKIYESNEVKQYHIKKVSQIPKEKEEMEKITIEDDGTLTPEELKERYYQYVIAQIEQNKDYPMSEQKMGHEGSVVLRLMIQRSGKIKNVQILRQARYLKLTRAAIAALKKSNPFQPYSDKIGEDIVSIQLEIKFFIR